MITNHNPALHKQREERKTEREERNLPALLSRLFPFSGCHGDYQRAVEIFDK